MRCVALALAALTLTAGAAQAAEHVIRDRPQEQLLRGLARPGPAPRSLNEILFAPKAEPLPTIVPAAVTPVIPKKTILRDEFGGRIDEHWGRFIRLRMAGGEVEVRGACESACTLVAGAIPKAKLCFGPNAYLGFHQAREADGSASPWATQWMLDRYPLDIVAWINTMGGAKAMPFRVSYWILQAPDLWAMGYRRCEEVQDPAVRMTTSPEPSRLLQVEKFAGVRGAHLWVERADAWAIMFSRRPVRYHRPPVEIMTHKGPTSLEWLTPDLAKEVGVPWLVLQPPGAIPFPPQKSGLGRIVEVRDPAPWPRSVTAVRMKPAHLTPLIEH